MRTHVTYTREGGRRLDAEHARRRSGPAQHVFVCGPTAFVEHTTRVLLEVGHEAVARARRALRRRHVKTYTLLGADGVPYTSAEPGLLGGHSRTRVYGRLDCPVALSLLRRGFTPRHRVFFADESDRDRRRIPAVRRVPAREVPGVEGTGRRRAPTIM